MKVVTFPMFFPKCWDNLRRTGEAGPEVPGEGEAGEAVPSEAAPSAPGDIGWDGNRDGSKYRKRVFKKKRKVNGKATLFYGDLIMGHSFGFIWIHLDVSESG